MNPGCWDRPKLTPFPGRVLGNFAAKKKRAPVFETSKKNVDPICKPSLKGTVFLLKIFKVGFSCDSYQFVFSLWQQHRFIRLWIVGKNSLLNLTSKTSFCAPFRWRNQIDSPLIFQNKKKYKPPRFFRQKKLLPLFLTTKKSCSPSVLKLDPDTP